jgi:CBS domain-containing protein
MMWDSDCGIVPVLNEKRHITGVITDRDICVAAATRSMRPADIRVRDVMSRETATCGQNDEVRTLLMTLKERRVRRLPVVDEEDRLVGISMRPPSRPRNDAILEIWFRGQGESGR